MKFRIFHCSYLLLTNSWIRFLQAKVQTLLPTYLVIFDYLVAITSECKDYYFNLVFCSKLYLDTPLGNFFMQLANTFQGFKILFSLQIPYKTVKIRK